MSEIVEPTIGERIRELRRPTYTQIDLAVAADVSVDVIRKLEQGRRLTASIPTLTRIARVLGVNVAALLSSRQPGADGGAGQARVRAIRDALTSIDDLLGELDDADAPDITELGRSVTYTWGAFYAGRYEPVAALPLASRSRHLTDVAYTQLRLGRPQAAESTLLTMEQAASEWTAHQRLPRLLVGELLTRGRPSSRLRALADRLDVRPGTSSR